jgi:hypothetical protein
MDPEGDQILYKFDWGDNTTSNWLGPCPSNQSFEASHIWTEPGEMQVCVKAIDINGSECDWSEPLIVNIVQGPVLDVGLLSSGFLKTEASIWNRGAVNAFNVSYRISLDGGFILTGKETTGTIPVINPGDYISISSGPIIGFGKTRVLVEAELPMSTDFREQGATIFLFYIYITPGGG